MHQKLEEIVGYAQKKLGLNDYSLHEHTLYREKDIFNNTIYILSMEWTPNNTKESSPAGNAVVELNFHTKAVKRIVFVQNVTNADSAVYPSADKENVIEWIEELTDLTFGRQFLLIEDEEDVLSFGAAVDNIPVAPPGTIHVEFNKDGQLCMFSIDGHFPEEDEISWEPFALTPDTYETTARKQCQLVEMPDEEQGKWLPVYGIEEVYLTNNGKGVIPFDAGLGSMVMNETVLTWDAPVNKAFSNVEVDFSTEAVLEQALINEPHPDTKPVSEQDVDACEETAVGFLRMVYPEDSGKWKLTGIYRSNGYLFAELWPAAGTSRVIKRKIKLIIDPGTYEAVNYIDNDRLLEMFGHLNKAAEAAISKEEAFSKLREHVEAEPVYVYDQEQGTYVMCGKLDCPYGIDAVTGELLLLGAF
ncbi:hypothetical protein ACFO3D_08315 [Virgibacillus kekensis]|uniref:Uncharacterized protein n=1 Tax=Virgibacillus kekensis TaxID=202261 RepID=A0ABV9DHE7_9BACI